MSEQEKQRRALPYVMALLGNAIWGFGFVLERYALQVEGSTPAMVLSVRFVLATVLVTILTLARGGWKREKGRAWKALLFLCVAQPVYYLLESYGIRYSNATFSGAVLSVSPIFAITAAAIFLKEYPTKKQILFSLLPIVGVIVLTISGRAIGVVQAVGVLFLLGTCLTSGLYKTVNRAASRDYDTMERTFAVNVGSALFFVILSMIETGGSLEPHARLLANPSFLLPVAALAVFGSLVANLLCNYATGKLSVMRITVFGAVSTVCASVGGVVFLGEPMPPAFLIGTALVIVGVWLVTVSKGGESPRDLEPRPFFRWFAAVCAIPHGSGKEQRLADMICRFAGKRRLPWEKDEKGNVLVNVPASPGYENEPPVLLQAHMDMIWAKAPGVKFDFEKQPIRLIVEDGNLHADGTTLGSDNAVGMATMLALADERKTIPHPPLELLFTVEEEVGLRGARAFDLHKIHARRMLNMDCGYSHILCLCSPGKISGGLEQTFSMEPAEGDALRVEITGGFDGHYATIMTQGRACCEGALGEILEGVPCRLVSVTQPTGNCHAAVTAVLIPEDGEAARKSMTERFEAFRGRYEKDPDLHLTITSGSAGPALSRHDTERVAALLRIIQPKVYGYLPEDPAVPATTGAIREVDLEDGRLTVSCMVRAYANPDMESLFSDWQWELAQQDLTLVEEDRYGGWPGREDSPFRAMFEDAHRRIVGSDVTYERIMGGIEVGVIVEAIPEMDAVGYAPSAHGAHTPKEYLEIGEVAPFWNVLLDVLARKTGEGTTGETDS